MSHPDSGFYERNQREYVSFSTVIDSTDHLFNPDKIEGLQRWYAMEPDWPLIIEDSCTRGKLIHHEIEVALGYAKDNDIQADAETLKRLQVPNFIHYLVGSNVLPCLHEGDPVAEEISYSDKFGFGCTTDVKANLKVKENRYDCELELSGQDLTATVIDWKTARPPEEGKEPKAKSRGMYKDAFLQLGANALAHNEMVASGERKAPKIKQGLIVGLYSWREPRMHFLNNEDLRKCAGKFLQRLQAYCKIYHTAFPRPAADC